MNFKGEFQLMNISTCSTLVLGLPLVIPGALDLVLDPVLDPVLDLVLDLVLHTILNMVPDLVLNMILSMVLILVRHPAQLLVRQYVLRRGLPRDQVLPQLLIQFLLVLPIPILRLVLCLVALIHLQRHPLLQPESHPHRVASFFHRLLAQVLN